MRPFTLFLCCIGVVLAGCTEPAGPSPSPDAEMASQAFRLNMDLHTGKVTMGVPVSSNGGAAYSLVGERIGFLATNGISCAPIPRSTPQQKRCTMALQITNDFESTDLMTPTEFPRPPQGTSGVLLFPYVATSNGTGGWAVPSPEWDHGPANFFNDFGSCSNGGKSDCYRYELLPSPFYAGAEVYLSEVGFDVPADASEVTAYLLVAADIRENPTRRVVLGRIASESGWVRDNGDVRVDDIALLYGEQGTTTGLATFRSFVSFGTAFAQGPIRVVSAQLRVYPFAFILPGLQAEMLDYGSSLDAGDYDLPPAPAASTVRLHCCVSAEWYFASVAPLVQSAADQGLARFQFRLTNDPSTAEWGVIDNRSHAAPELIIEYRMR